MINKTIAIYVFIDDLLIKLAHNEPKIGICLMQRLLQQFLCRQYIFLVIMRRL